MNMLSEGKFILSKSKVLEQYQICKSLSDMVSYSYKTNNEVGKILEDETDCMFTLHMHNTIPKIKNKSRIWFHAQGFSDDEIKMLIESGVKNFIVDNEADLDLLLDFLNKSGKNKINLLLRMRLKENTIHTGKYFVFGFYSDKINSLIPTLRKNKLIEKLGVHFHRKTQNLSEWSLKNDIESVLSEETISSIDLLNIGGGIPSEYKNFRSEVMKSIFDKIHEMKTWLNSKNIKMIIEPGRFIAASPVKLESEIINIYNDNIIINCSVYNSANDTFVANIRLLVEGELPDGEGEPYTIKGSTPCSMDIFRYRVFLEKPKVGDKIVFLNAGAYNYASDFCNLEKLKTVVVD
jgi:ornithine decarboxylase